MFDESFSENVAPYKKATNMNQNKFVTHGTPFSFLAEIYTPSTLKMEEAGFSKTIMFYQTMQHRIPEDCNLHNNSRGNP
jgi:hypothetical protein